MVVINASELTEELRARGVAFRQVGEVLTIYEDGDEIPAWIQPEPDQE